MEEFDVRLIDWPSAVAIAEKRFRVRIQPLLRGVLLDAELSDHPSLTPSGRMAGNVMIELHRMLDPLRGTLDQEMESIPALARARKLRNAIAGAAYPLPSAKELDMARFYARALAELLLDLLRRKGFQFVMAIGHAPPKNEELPDIPLI